MYEKTILRVAHIEESTELLGPYNRFVIWAHGCCFNCDGCLAHNTRFGSFAEESIDALSQRVINSGCEGITISGGEPFLQASALSAFIHKMKSARDIGVIIYSGFTIKEIRKPSDFLTLLSQTDTLIHAGAV